MLAYKLAFLGKDENEMQEKSRLQHSGTDVAPVDCPVEIVQLAGVLEGIGNERDEAENVEVRRAGSSPAAQQNVESNAEVNECDQPQPVVERTLRRNQNH